MQNIFREIRLLREAGKLHKKLITRTRTLFIISLVLGVIVCYNIIFRAVDPFIVLGLISIGFALGFFVFTRMNVVNWNEEDEVVQTGRMDAIGFVIIASYVVFEIGLRTVLKDFYPVSATAFVLAAIFGTLLGRAIGTLVEIDRVYRANFDSK